jgi:hypothetical protein
MTPVAFLHYRIQRKRGEREGEDQDEGRVKRRDGEESRGKMLSNGRRTTRRKQRSRRCRRVNSKQKSEEGNWKPQYFSYRFLLLSYPLLDMNISMKVYTKTLYGSFFLSFSLKIIIMCKFIKPTSFVELQLVTILYIHMTVSL